MNLKTFFLGAALGAIGGITAKAILNQKTSLSAEKVLEHAKKKFKHNGPISGSWIHMETESYQKHHIPYRVYKGGISKNNNGTTEQYEFIADATTGTLIEIRPLTKELKEA